MISPTPFLMKDACALVPDRPSAMHKGSRGKLLIAGGSSRYPGAPALSALGALRSGSGVVTLLSLPEVCRACAARLPEVVHLPVEGDWIEAALDALPTSTAAVVGPGLGRSEESVAFVRAMWERWTLPILIDGDALFALAQCPPHSLSARTDAVLTPHEGEAARLLGVSASDIGKDRIGSSERLAERWGCVLLKGHGSLITCNGEMRRLDVGGPELSVPGSGDVLSGAIGAFLSMGLSPRDAALLGGMLHALSGLELRRKRGVDGNLASEIADGLNLDRLKHAKEPRL